MSITSWRKNMVVEQNCLTTRTAATTTEAPKLLKTHFSSSFFTLYLSIFISSNLCFQIHFPSTQILNHILPKTISIISKLQNPSQTHKLTILEPQLSIYHSKHQRGVTMEEFFVLCCLFLCSLWIIVDCGVICMY